MITIREARIEDAAGMAKVHVDSWRTTYAGIVPGAYLAKLSYAGRENLWHDILGNASGNQYHFVAVNDDGKVIGFVSGGPQTEWRPHLSGGIVFDIFATGAPGYRHDITG